MAVIKLLGLNLFHSPKVYELMIRFTLVFDAQARTDLLFLEVSCRPEINIGPWDAEFSGIKQGSQVLNWTQKLSYAYWKGNPDVQSPVRVDLLQCNNSDIIGAQVMRQVLCNYHLDLFLSKIWTY